MTPQIVPSPLTTSTVIDPAPGTAPDEHHRGPQHAPGSYCLRVCYCGQHTRYTKPPAGAPAAPKGPDGGHR